MLLGLEFWVGVLAVGILALFGRPPARADFQPGSLRLSLHRCGNEYFVWLSILFGFAFVHMTLKGFGNAGHIYSVSTYLWMFAMSLDDVPRLVEQYSNLKDIGQRVELSEKGLA